MWEKSGWQIFSPLTKLCKVCHFLIRYKLFKNENTQKLSSGNKKSQWNIALTELVMLQNKFSLLFSVKQATET